MTDSDTKPDKCTRCGADFDAGGNLGDSYFLCDGCATEIRVEIRKTARPGSRIHAAAQAAWGRIQEVTAGDPPGLAEATAVIVIGRALARQDREAEIRTWMLAYAMLADPNAGEIMRGQIARLGGKL